MESITLFSVSMLGLANLGTVAMILLLHKQNKELKNNASL